MREIKFRFWLPFIGKMTFAHTLPEIEKLGLSGDEIPMQFTGLRDKNGVEIYEGDIVKASRMEQNRPETGYGITDTVTFHGGSFEMFSKPLSKFYTSDGICETKWCDPARFVTPAIYYEITAVEVIGNIYTHPHLLTSPTPQ